LCRCCLELMLGLLRRLVGLWGGCGGSWCTLRFLLDGVGCRCRRGVLVGGWVWWCVWHVGRSRRPGWALCRAGWWSSGDDERLGCGCGMDRPWVWLRLQVWVWSGLAV